MSGKHPQWLFTTVNAVRDLMLKRLARPLLDDDGKREAEMAVKALDLLWEQLEGEAEQLTREHERYLAFFDNAPDAFVVTDAGLCLREINRAAAELFRLSVEEMRGRSLASFLAEEDRAAFLVRFVSFMAAPAPATWTGRIRGGRREPVAVHLGVRPIPLAHSGVAGLCWVVRPD